MVFRARVIAQTENRNANGQQLLYSGFWRLMDPLDCWGPPPSVPPSSELMGIRGGAVLDESGNLLALHSQSQTSIFDDLKPGLLARPIVNRGVPVATWSSITRLCQFQRKQNVQMILAMIWLLQIPCLDKVVRNRPLLITLTRYCGDNATAKHIS